MVNNKINGFKNEAMFAEYLNGKKIKNLYPNYQDLIIDLFGNVNYNLQINCWVDHSKKKYDIIIKLGGRYKRLSIKKGINNSVHTEGISSFIHFLIENNIPRDIIIKYLKYHYSDGSTNGKGTERISSIEYKELYPQDIIDINRYFSDKSLVKKCIYRFVLQGTNSSVSIDGLIYGTVDDFIYISKQNILDILLKHVDNIHNGVSFSDLFCQAKAKNLNNNPKYEKDRFCVQIKWFNIFDCILENMYDNFIKDVNV